MRDDTHANVRIVVTLVRWRDQYTIVPDHLIHRRLLACTACREKLECARKARRMTGHCPHRHAVRITHASPDLRCAKVIVSARVERHLLCRYQDHESRRRERLRHRRQRERRIWCHAARAILVGPTKALLPNDLSIVGESYRQTCRPAGCNLTLDILPDRGVLISALCRFEQKESRDNRNNFIHDR